MNPVMAKQGPRSRNKKQKAALYIRKGQLGEAERLLVSVCKSNPLDVEAWMMLAGAHGKQGNFDAVIHCCQQVLSTEPGHPQANSLLGNAQAGLGHLEEAMESYRNALKTKPRDPGILNNLGNALYLAGELEEAADKLARVVRIKPDYADAHNNLGNIYMALNRNNEAIQHLRHATELDPKLFEAHLNLGNIFSERVAQPEKAEGCYRKALKLKPDHLEARIELASVLVFQGRLDEALETYEQAERIHPGFTPAIAGAAAVCERQGRHDEAYRRVRDLIDAGKANATAANVLVRLCQRYDCCSEAIELAEQCLSSESERDAGKQGLHFALGKLHDKLGDFDQAFEHFRQGNNSIDVPFDRNAFRRDMDNLIRSFSKDTLKSLPRSTHTDTRPVFIVGMPRSGTSLTEQILASHPEVHGAGELNDLHNIAADIPAESGCKTRYPECITHLDQDTVNRLAQRYQERLDSFSTEARRISDKMPHNFLNLGLISILFPDARIIHCVRDPRDTCLSIYFQNFGWIHPYATKLDNLGLYYREYLRLMSHWESVLDIPMMTVKYEEMVANQERISRSMVDFCGLEWDDACLQFHQSKRTVATASYDQVRQPIYTRSRARWKNYTQHIGALVDSLGEALEN